MRFLGTAKIGRLVANGITYPQLRLPKQKTDTIGDKACIYETSHEGKQAFLIVTERDASEERTLFKKSEQFLKTEESVQCGEKADRPQTTRRGGVAWLSYGPVEATTRVRISPSAFCFFYRARDNAQ